jgi:hypothetical protein
VSPRPQTLPAWIAELGLPTLMTVPEVAALLRVSRAEGYRLAHSLDPVHVGRAVRVPGVSVRRYLAEKGSAS